MGVPILDRNFFLADMIHNCISSGGDSCSIKAGFRNQSIAKALR